ncbi:UTP--glucose-1-phosphate uridylyltransferase [Deltaproteobacteria bacterium TL4]
MKGVILAAGYATRFLPASKTLPKEMFPLIDRPVIDFIVQEMVDSGIQDILLVTSRRKKVMEDYFDREFELSTVLEQKNSYENLAKVKPAEANIFTTRQQSMLGTANALLLVEPFAKGEPFIVAYPDDIVVGTPPLSQQMIAAYEKTHKTILAVEELLDEDVSRYGVIGHGDVDADGIMAVHKMTEKPAQGTEPSRMVSYGRYLYTPEIFDALRASKKDRIPAIEFTQTDAINQLAEQGKVAALQFKGRRYDVGEPLGYVMTTIQMALQRADMRDPMLTFLTDLLKQEKKHEN